MHGSCRGCRLFLTMHCLTLLQERVKANKLKNAWLQCRKDYAVYLQDDGRVFVFFPSSFPWHKKDKYKVLGQGKASLRRLCITWIYMADQFSVLPLGEERKVGPWTVRSEIVSHESDCQETFRLAQKAMPSMEDLMNGKIEYFITSPTWYVDGKFSPRPLVFCHFTKATRPAAWKSCDLKVQQTLPILGNDATAEAAMKNLEGSGLIHQIDGLEQPNPTRLIKVSLELSQ